MSDLPARITPLAAFERYEQVRPRMPPADFAGNGEMFDDLSDLVDRFDAFVLDGFGVLNVGDAPVPGAPERVAQLRAAGKHIRVLTNGASFPSARTAAKYRAWGFEMADAEVISSRDVLAAALAKFPESMHWGFAATTESNLDELVPHATLLRDDPADYAAADGIVMLSALDWNADRQELLYQAMMKQRRPFLVGNPDLVAPREDFPSLEPGWFANDIADRTRTFPTFFGKPYRNAFEMVAATLPGVAPDRIAMVGDSFHTDILGAASFGWRSILVISHGLYKDEDIAALCERSGIFPDYSVERT